MTNSIEENIKKLRKNDSNFVSPNTIESATKGGSHIEDTVAKLFGKEIKAKKEIKLSKGKKSHYLTRIDELLAKLKTR